MWFNMETRLLLGAFEGKATVSCMWKELHRLGEVILYVRQAVSAAWLVQRLCFCVNFLQDHYSLTYKSEPEH